MLPEASQRAQSTEHRAKFRKLSIPELWIEPLFALGYDSVEKLKEVEKPGKLANDLNGYKKKNKLEIPTLTLEQVARWIG